MHLSEHLLVLPGAICLNVFRKQPICPSFLSASFQLDCCYVQDNVSCLCWYLAVLNY